VPQRLSGVSGHTGPFWDKSLENFPALTCLGKYAWPWAGVLGVVYYFLSIPRSRHNPKILWIDDAEIVGDRIT
jgi:hypothetical protein